MFTKVDNLINKIRVHQQKIDNHDEALCLLLAKIFDKYKLIDNTSWTLKTYASSNLNSPPHLELIAGDLTKDNENLFTFVSRMLVAGIAELVLEEGITISVTVLPHIRLSKDNKEIMSFKDLLVSLSFTEVRFIKPYIIEHNLSVDPSSLSIRLHRLNKELGYVNDLAHVLNYTKSDTK